MSEHANVTIMNRAEHRRAIAEIVGRYNPNFSVEQVEASMAEHAERALYAVVSEAQKDYSVSTMGYRVEVEQVTDTLIVVDYLVEASVLFCHLKDNS